MSWWDLMGKMNSRVVLSVVLLLVATSVLSTGFTVTAATSAPASYCTWDPVAKKNICVSEPSGFSQTTSQLPNCPNYPNYSNYPNCPNYPNYPYSPNYPNYPNTPNYPNYPYYSNYGNYPYSPNYPNYPGYPNYPNYGNYANYPCLCDPNDPNCLCRPNYPNYPYSPNYPNYPYYYSNPSYGYGVVTETVTATNYSFVTQTNEVTSIPAPVTVTASATVTATSTTSDTTAETLYSTLMAVFLALFLATLVLLVGSRYRGSKGSNPQSSQAAIAAPAQARIATSYKCSACGTGVDLGSKFCGSCGAQLKSK
jgi:hypothetical protein